MALKIRYKKPKFLLGKQSKLWQDYHAWQRDCQLVLKPYQLTYFQSIILLAIQWLSEESACITQIQVARLLDVDPMMLSVSLRKMEAKEWLSRQVHPSDLRSKQLVLQEKAIVILPELDKTLTALLD